MANAYHKQKNGMKGVGSANEETFYFPILEEPLNNGSQA